MEEMLSAYSGTTFQETAWNSHYMCKTQGKNSVQELSDHILYNVCCFKG
jgi:hypothetical protein